MMIRRQNLQRFQSLALAHTSRTLAQTPRYVSQSARQNVSIPASAQVSTTHLLSTQPESQIAQSKAVLGRLPTETVLRSYLITAISSRPLLLNACFGILRRMLDSKSFLLSIERNPVLSNLLKKTFYAQYCVGEKKDEVVKNTEFARTLGYGGILFEYALEVLGGKAPTAEETKMEIEVWRKGMLQSVDMAKEGDFVGLK
jgi:hypothetical protein